jgi:membrane protein implicated in regulation of membrane protease activity
VQPATLLAGAVVVLTAMYLLVFGVCAIAAPSRAAGYLHGFACSAGLHVMEMIVRLVVGRRYRRSSTLREET